MTLPWVRYMWEVKHQQDARAERAALSAAALGSGAKYGGDSGRAYRSRMNELSKVIEAKHKKAD